MTIKEAHKAWGGKADHLLTYHHTKEVFAKGFATLDLDKPIDYYDKKDYAKALKQSELNASEAYLAASVICNVLKEYSIIGYTAEDVMDAMQTAVVPQQHTEKAAVTQQHTKKTKTNMKGNTKPKSVQQLDPTSGKVICTYNSISEAQSKIGVKNIYRAIETGNTAGGYKWKLADAPSKVAVTQQHTGTTAVAQHTKQGTQEAVAQPHTEQTSLANLSDQELIDEMKRRGWKGNVEIVVRVTL